MLVGNRVGLDTAENDIGIKVINNEFGEGNSIGVVPIKPLSVAFFRGDDEIDISDALPGWGDTLYTGAAVYGVGIPSGSYIKDVIVDYEDVGSQAGDIVQDESTISGIDGDELSEGMVVTGAGIATGTTILRIEENGDGAVDEIKLSKKLTADVAASTLTFKEKKYKKIRLSNPVTQKYVSRNTANDHIRYKDWFELASRK